MDFKTRFQGKMTQVKKDGGIVEAMIQPNSQPITRIENMIGNAGATQQLISYGALTNQQFGKQ
jgi:hypothetical protein